MEVYFRGESKSTCYMEKTLCVGKFLRYCSPDLDNPDFRNLLDISLIDAYIEALEDAMLSPSGIYNRLAYLHGGQAFASFILNIKLDPCLQKAVKERMDHFLDLKKQCRRLKE